MYYPYDTSVRTLLYIIFIYGVYDIQMLSIQMFNLSNLFIVSDFIVI